MTSGSLAEPKIEPRKDDTLIDDLWLAHALLSVRVVEVLDELHTFLDSHPYEIVLLDVQHTYDVEAHEAQVLISYIEKMFSSKLAPPSLSLDVTLQDMWAQQYQVRRLSWPIHRSFSHAVCVCVCVAVDCVPFQ